VRLITGLALLVVSTQSVAADKMTLILDWFINPDHGPIIIAEENGYFAELGLEVEIVAPSDPSDPPKWWLRARRNSRFPINRNCICRSTKACP
jgi:putative hydroxymethylpyrimidine transport system substrate-binding protein